MNEYSEIMRGLGEALEHAQGKRECPNGCGD